MGTYCNPGALPQPLLGPMFAFLEVIWLTAKMMLPPSRPFMPMGGPMGGPINPMGGLPGMPSMPQPGTVPGVLPQPGLPQTILPQPGLPSPGMCQGAPGTLLPQPAMAQTLPTPQLPGTVPQPFAGVGVLPRPPMNPGMCANTMPPRCLFVTRIRRQICFLFVCLLSGQA